MRHCLFYKKHNCDTNHRKALIRNLAKSLFKYKRIVTTKPKSVSCISFTGRFISRMLKQSNTVNAIRYIKKHITGNDKASTYNILSFYELNRYNIKSNYIYRKNAGLRCGDSAKLCIIGLM